MKKVVSLVLCSLLTSYSLSGCNSQVNVPAEMPAQTQDVSAMSAPKVNEMDIAFKYLDSDKDGKVSFTELKKMMDILAPYASDKNKLYSNFNSAFDSSDLNKSKSLDKPEFSSFITSLSKASGQVSKNSVNSYSPEKVNSKLIKQTYDIIRGSDENINERAFIKYVTILPDVSPTDAERVFINLDKNNDGLLTLAEFSKLFTSSNDLLKNGIWDKTKELASIIPLILVAPILYIMDKIGLFNNIK